MSAAIERIVIRVTPEDKRAIVGKARRLGLSVSELLRRAVSAYEADAASAGWGRLADSAQAAADRASSAVEDALSAIEASERRLPALTLCDPGGIMMHRV